MNELLDAAQSDDGDDSSEERYEKLKQEEAGSDQTQAEKRYEELKEKAKQEFVKEVREEEQEDEQEDPEQDEGKSDKGDGFITY